VQGIAEHDEPGDRQIGRRRRQLRGDAAAHRLAPDEEKRASRFRARPHLLDERRVARLEHGRSIRHSPPLFHVGEVEGDEIDPEGRRRAGEADDEWAVLACAGAVGEDERRPEPGRRRVVVGRRHRLMAGDIDVEDVRNVRVGHALLRPSAVCS
jgi:hypothetical protein